MRSNTTLCTAVFCLDWEQWKHWHIQTPLLLNVKAGLCPETLTKRFSGTKSFTASKLLAFDLLSFAIKRHFSETSGKERKDDETYQQGHSRAQIYCTSYESTLFMGKKRLG